MSIKRYPIRLIHGIGNNMVQGIGIIFEKENGQADRLNFWFEDNNTKLIAFSDEESYVELKIEKGFFSEAIKINRIVLSRENQKSVL